MGHALGTPTSFDALHTSKSTHLASFDNDPHFPTPLAHPRSSCSLPLFEVESPTQATDGSAKNVLNVKQCESRGEKVKQEHGEQEDNDQYQTTPNGWHWRSRRASRGPLWSLVTRTESSKYQACVRLWHDLARFHNPDEVNAANPSSSSSSSSPLPCSSQSSSPTTSKLHDYTRALRHDTLHTSARPACNITTLLYYWTAKVSHDYTTTLLHYCTTQLLDQHTTTLPHSYSTALLHDCTITLLQCYTATLLRYYATVAPRGYTIARATLRRCFRVPVTSPSSSSVSSSSSPQSSVCSFCSFSCEHHVGLPAGNCYQ